MRYTVFINQKRALEWGMSLQEAFVYAFLYELPSWAETLTIGNQIYYFAARQMVAEQIPLLSKKTDTVYRYFKKLEGLGLIELIRVGNRDYIALTSEAEKWNSENNPTLGKSSEQTRKIIRPSSENNPTDNIIKDNKIIDKGKAPPSRVFKKPTLEEVVNYFKAKKADPETAKKAFDYYEAANWYDGRGNKVVNWKQKMISIWMKKDERKKQFELKNIDYGEE